jgi:hypothetical protein
MRVRSVFCLLAIIVILFGSLPSTTLAQPGKGLSIALDAEVAGDDIIKFHITVRNIDTDDLGPIWVTGFIPEGGRLEKSWAGIKEGENQGNASGREVNWTNAYIKSQHPPAGSTFVPGPLIYHYVVRVPSGMLIKANAQVRWDGRNKGTVATSVITAAGPVITPGVPPAGQMDYALSNGWFYKQANGQGGNGDKGFAVVDGGNDGGGSPVQMWAAYKAFGGPERIGYPISRRYKDQVNDTYTYQAFQKAIIQWDSVTHKPRLVNLMDALHDAGLDPKLEQKGYAPWEPDASGGDYTKARQIRLSWLEVEGYEDLKDAYLNTPFFEDFLGLPGAKPRTYGTIRVLRLQRAVFASYNNGPVVAASAGDDAKSLGYLNGDCLLPQDPTERDLGAWAFRTTAQAQALTPAFDPTTQQAASPTSYKYFVEWTEVRPNCSHTFLRGTMRDGYNNPVYGEKIRTWNDWGNEAISLAGAWGPGGWERDMGDGIRPGTWHIQVLHPTSGRPLSPVIDVRFTETCKASNDAQEIIVHFRAFAGY